MFDIVESVAQKKARLNRLQAELDQLLSDIDILTKALAILERHSHEEPIAVTSAPSVKQEAHLITDRPGVAASAPPKHTLPAAEVRIAFP